MEVKYQTLGEFVNRPFESSKDMASDTRLANIYQKLKMENSDVIHIEGVTTVENTYFVHVQVPSESEKKHDNAYFYDVVIRFFPDDPSVTKESHLRNYKIQFYSNCPSFIYQYAYLYHKNGFLIEELYGKTDTKYINTPPTKRNPNMNVNYDKSIYLACRYLSDGKFRWLDKFGPLTTKKKSKNAFFKTITDFQGVKLDQAIFNEERKLAKQLASPDPKERELAKMQPKTSTAETSRTFPLVHPKIRGKGKVRGITKKTATRSTFRKK